MIAEATDVAEFGRFDYYGISRHPLVLSRSRGQWLVELRGFWTAYATAADVRAFAAAIIHTLDEGEGEIDGDLGRNPYGPLEPLAEFAVGYDETGLYLLAIFSDGTCGSPILQQRNADPAHLRAGARKLLSALDA